MIDTVVFKLHNLADRYPMLLELYKVGKSGKTIMAHLPDDGDQVPVQLRKFVGPDKAPVEGSMEKYLLDYLQQRAIPLRHYDKLNVPSSNHEVAYCIHPMTSTLEVQFSIPKYLYGNNVMELVIPPHHKDFTVNAVSPYAHIDYCYRQVKKLVPRIIYQIARGNDLGSPLHLADIEIVRLDVCVNQVFGGKVEALRYLKYQKKILKHFERVSSPSNRMMYDTSFTYKTDRYYVKVYHKGAEFRSKQRGEIIKLNEARRKAGAEQLSSNIKYAGQHIEALQEYADRVIRYEFEFRPSYMSYVFNNRINKVWSKEFQKMKKIYKFVSRKPEDLEFLLRHERRYVDNFNVEHEKPLPPGVPSMVKYYVQEFDEVTETRKLREFTHEQYQIILFLAKFGYRKQRDVKLWVKGMRKELDDVRKFYLQKKGPDVYGGYQINHDSTISRLSPVSVTPSEIEFRPIILEKMLDELKKFFENFQLENKTPQDELLTKIEQYNTFLDSQISYLGDEPGRPETKEGKRIARDKVGERSKTYLLAFHRSVAMSMREMISNQVMSRSTYFKMKSLYAKITGHTCNVGAAYFGTVNRNFNEMYSELLKELTFGYFGRFYDKAHKKYYRV